MDNGTSRQEVVIAVDNAFYAIKHYYYTLLNDNAAREKNEQKREWSKTAKTFEQAFVLCKYVSQIPIPNIDPSQKALLESLVDEILAERTAPDADVVALEKEIDRVVYSLYNLTREEIEIVEGATE